jgi:hypothetical protein
MLVVLMKIDQSKGLLSRSEHDDQHWETSGWNVATSQFTVIRRWCIKSPKMEMSNWVKLMISHFATDSEFPTWRFIDSCWVYILLAECGQPAETHRTARKIKQAMYCYIWLPPIQTIQTIPPLHWSATLVIVLWLCDGLGEPTIGQ